MAEFLDPVVIKVRADVDDALLKLRAVKAELKSLGNTSAHIRIKDGFVQANMALRDTKTALRDVDSETGRLGRTLSTVGRSYSSLFRDINRGAKDGHGLLGSLLGGSKGFVTHTFSDIKSLGSALQGVFSALTGGGASAGQAASQLGEALSALGADASIALPALGLVAIAVTGVGAAVNGLMSATGALLAGGLGLGAFAAVALPQFKAVSGAMSQITKDTQAYHRALSATAKADALKHLEQDWQSLTPAQRQAVHGIDQLKASYDKIVKATAKPVFSVFNAALRVASHLLPYLQPLATAAAGALKGLLGQADKFVQSNGFKQWIGHVVKIVPGAISAVGHFIGKLAALVGQTLVNKNSLNDLRDVLRFVYSAVNDTIRVVQWLARAWQTVSKFLSPFIGLAKAALNIVNSLLGPVGGLAGMFRDLGAAIDYAARAASALGGLISSGSGMASSIVGRLGFANGTPGAPPGWAWVGERGPELMKMTGGEQVIPHGPSMAVARGYANGTPGAMGALGGGLNVSVYLDGKKMHGVVKKQNYVYNGNNGNRAKGGGPSGAWTPRMAH